MPDIEYDVDEESGAVTQHTRPRTVALGEAKRRLLQIDREVVAYEAELEWRVKERDSLRSVIARAEEAKARQRPPPPKPEPVPPT